MKNDRPTIAVMGVPIDRTYPAANAALRQQIERKGCVISEYPPYSEYVGPNCFLQRNRLIAALSSAVLVVEAREKSGTMSTVAHAERYGKPVYAVPGSIYSPNSAGTNGLLRDGRARAVAGAADLLAALGLHTRQAAPAAAKQPAPLSDTERRVMACIGTKTRGHRGAVREHRPAHVRAAGHPDEAGTDRPGVQAAGAAVCAAVKLWNISAGKAHNSCGTII